VSEPEHLPDGPLKREFEALHRRLAAIDDRMRRMETAIERRASFAEGAATQAVTPAIPATPTVPAGPDPLLEPAAWLETMKAQHPAPQNPPAQTPAQTPTPAPAPKPAPAAASAPPPSKPAIAASSAVPPAVPSRPVPPTPSVPASPAKEPTLAAHLRERKDHATPATAATPATPATPANSSAGRPPAWAPDASATDASTERPLNAVSLEQFLGGKVAAWVGALIVVIAAGFFVKFAYDQGWIGNTPKWVRLLVATLFGFGFLGAGELGLRRLGRPAAVGFFGAGVGTLVITALASARPLDVLSEPMALLASTIAAAIGIGVAWRSRSAAVGALAILGALLAPAILGILLVPGVALPFHITAVMILGLGISALAEQPFRQLRWLTIVGSILVTVPWFFTVGREMPFISIPMVAIWWALVIGESWFAAVRGQSTNSNAIAAVVATAAAASTASLAVIGGPFGSAWASPFGYMPFALAALAAVAAWQTVALGNAEDAIDEDERRIARATGVYRSTLLVSAGTLVAVGVGVLFRYGGLAITWSALAWAYLELGRLTKARVAQILGFVTLSAAGLALAVTLVLGFQGATSSWSMGEAWTILLPNGWWAGPFFVVAVAAIGIRWRPIAEPMGGALGEFLDGIRVRADGSTPPRDALSVDAPRGSATGDGLVVFAGVLWTVLALILARWAALPAFVLIGALPAAVGLFVGWPRVLASRTAIQGTVVALTAAAVILWCIVALCAAIEPDHFGGRGLPWPTFAVPIAIAFAMGLLTVPMSRSRRTDQPWLCATVGFVLVAITLEMLGLRNGNNLVEVGNAIAVTAAVMGWLSLAVCLLGIALRRAAVTTLGLIVLTLACVSWCALGTLMPRIDSGVQPGWPILNVSSLTGLALVAAAGCAAWLLRRVHRESAGEGEAIAPPALHAECRDHGGDDRHLRHRQPRRGTDRRRLRPFAAGLGDALSIARQRLVGALRHRQHRHRLPPGDEHPPLGGSRPANPHRRQGPPRRHELGSDDLAGGRAPRDRPCPGRDECSLRQGDADGGGEAADEEGGR
jgi:hypothetical protein